MSIATELDQHPSAAEYAAAMKTYQQAGAIKLAQLKNKGPLKLDASGQLDPSILDAYSEQGFYIFEGLIGDSEVADLQADIQNLLDRAPASPGSDTDSKGRPAFGQTFARPPYLFIKPLSDPWGGTKVLGGRHPNQMIQPVAHEGAPEDVVHIINGMCQSMSSGLRVYGHPGLLKIAAAINGDDFVPYNDVIFVKQPGWGGSVSWHQDGVTHWDAPNWDEGIHGFNFQVQVYGATAENCLWVVPGTHKRGKIDILALIDENNGSEQLPQAVPLTCKPGDVTIVNRQCLHGSFANASPDPRVSLTFGFHRRSSVLGAIGALSQGGDEVYDEERIFERAKVIQLAIDARQQYFDGETPFKYQPFAGLEDEHRWDPTRFDDLLKDYNLKDLSI